MAACQTAGRRSISLALLHLVALTAIAATLAAAAEEGDTAAADAAPQPAAYPAPLTAQLQRRSYVKQYDVAIVTKLPGRRHPLRILSAILSSAAVTNAFGDARRVFIVINSHYNESNPMHNSNMLRNLNVGRTSVHFLPDYYLPQQCSGVLYAMELYLRHGGTTLHGLLTLEDDIVFGPDFNQHLAEALAQSDEQDTLRQHSSNRLNYMLRMYATSQDVYTDEKFPIIEDAVNDVLARHAMKTVELSRWEKVEVGGTSLAAFARLLMTLASFCDLISRGHTPTLPTYPSSFNLSLFSITPLIHRCRLAPAPMALLEPWRCT